MNTKYIKTGILIFLLLLMLLPYVQRGTTFVKFKPLHDGAFIVDKVPLTKKNWFSGEFQKAYVKFINERVGFRNFFIRLRNQIEYSLFNLATPRTIIVGKKNVLIQEGYINAYLGKDYIGQQEIRKRVKKMKYVQDELKKKNIDFIFLMAPGKARYLPEYIPSYYDLSQKDTTNYEIFIKEMTRYNINFFDATKYFMQMKDTVSYPLFPRCGTHWSGYALTLVADSLFRYMEKLRGVDIINYYVQGGEVTNKNFRFTDADLVVAMNLLWDIPSYMMFYPNVIFKEDSAKKKPNILGIGDSFFQSFYGFYPYFDKVFDKKSRFWYYNKLIDYPDCEERFKSVEDLNLKKEIEQRDFILMVSTEQTLKDFGFGFTENVYNILTLEERIEFFETQIKNNKEWLEMVDKKAKERKINLDDMVWIDAVFMAKQEL